MSLLRKQWWKVVAIVFTLYTIIAGFLTEVPSLPILHETIRNLYFHVCMWFAMMIVMTISLVYSIRYLRTYKHSFDIVAEESARVGIFFGILGLLTGMLWANYTWGDWWVNDMKLNGAAATLLVYLAYILLRNSIEDDQRKARISAVYNIFSFVLMMVFIMILPRMTDSLHPGSGGNPAFNAYDLDNRMRLVFYPAIIGWTLLGIWIIQLRVKLNRINQVIDNDYDESFN
jgi:heme exporter protein C